MKYFPNPAIAIGLAVIWTLASLTARAESKPSDRSHEPSNAEVVKEVIRSLDISVNILRTGQIEIVQDFVITLADDGTIKRGPILSYLTVYRGLGNLVLDHRMKVQEVLRNGKPEPFKIEDHKGITRIVCGSGEVLLNQGDHRYTIRITRNGDWVFRDGMAHWAYEITESFKSFPIEALTFQLNLPDGVELAYCTPALSGSEALGGTGYQLTEGAGIFKFETTAPLSRQSLMFLNAGWKSNSFATQSQWFEVMRQHPKLPISGFSAIILLGSLVILLVRIVKNHQVPAVPSA